MKRQAPAAFQIMGLTKADLGCDYQNGRETVLGRAESPVALTREGQRLVTSSFSIEAVWKEASEGLQNFRAPLWPAGMPAEQYLTELYEAVMLFIYTEMKRAFKKMVGRPEDVVLYILHSIALTDSGVRKTPIDHIADEMNAGASIVASMAEVVAKVFQREFTREITLEEYMTILRSPAFVHIFVALSYTHGQAESGLLTRLELYPSIANSRSNSRPVYDPSYFRFIEHNGGIALSLEPSLMAEVKARYDSAKQMGQLTAKRVCPATAVHGTEHSVVKEFSTAMLETIIKDYLPGAVSLRT